MKKIIKLELSLDDVNKILNAMGNLPYANVFELVNSIQKQANPQIIPVLKPITGKSKPKKKMRGI